MDFDGNFETHALPPEDLPKVMEKLRNGELSGVVATMPFKTPSLEYLDEASEEVKAVNAVNVILGEHSMKSSGLKKLHGYNTDWLGAKGAIEMVMPDLTGKKALILGAGGAARAAVRLAGVHVHLEPHSGGKLLLKKWISIMWKASTPGAKSRT